MIRSSACPLRRTDPLPASTGQHGERRSYTTTGDTISPSLDKLKQQMHILKEKVESGEFDELFKEIGDNAIPSAIEISNQSGNNQYFLFGPKHRNTTRPAVEAFRDELVTALKRKFAAPRKSRTTQERINEIADSRQRIADHCHIYATRMRAMRRELTKLKKASRPKVISFHGQRLNSDDT